MESIKNESEVPHYSELLLSELKVRCSKNSRYSLRSFARDLNLSPSFLSRIIRHETSLSVLKAQSLLGFLKWTRSKKRFFILLVQFHACPPGEARDAFFDQIKKTEIIPAEFYFDLSREHEALLSGWYHLAIVELSLHPDFKDSPEWIASRLNISLAEVCESVQRLLLLGLLYHNGQKLVRSQNRYWIGNFHSSHIRGFHLQHLKIAAKALDSQSMAERMFMGSTFPLPLNKMDEVKELIQDFHKKVLALAEQTPPDQIYHLAVQLYRLDHSIKLNNIGK